MSHPLRRGLTADCTASATATSGPETRRPCSSSTPMGTWLRLRLQRLGWTLPLGRRRRRQPGHRDMVGTARCDKSWCWRAAVSTSTGTVPASADVSAPPQPQPGVDQHALEATLQAGSASSTSSGWATACATTIPTATSTPAASWAPTVMAMVPSFDPNHDALHAILDDLAAARTTRRRLEVIGVPSPGASPTRKGSCCSVLRQLLHRKPCRLRAGLRPAHRRRGLTIVQDVFPVGGSHLHATSCSGAPCLHHSKSPSRGTRGLRPARPWRPSRWR